MKLYSAPHSPFAARVLIALRYKNIACELVPPPEDGMRSPAYLALNPLGKLPLLVTDSGTPIPESETILSYLDELWPTPALLPPDPLARAQVRNVVRVLESYVTPALFRLFGQLDPSTRDGSRFDAEVRRWGDGLEMLSHFVGAAPASAGDPLTIADCMLFPSLQLCQIIASILGQDDPLARYAPLGEYYARAGGHPILGGMRDEVAAAITALNR